MHQPLQLQLFDFPSQPQIKVIHDPYWDEIEKTSDNVNEAFSSSVECRVLNSGDEQIAPEHNTQVRAQISLTQSPYKSVRAQVNTDTAPEHNYPESAVNSDTSNPYTHWVEKYWVKRRGEKHEYYRYCWMEGRKKYRCHISGRAGSIGANHRKKMVIDALAQGESPQEIKQMIRGFRS